MDIIQKGFYSAQHMGSLDEQLMPVTSLRSFGLRAPWRSYPAPQQGKRLEFSCCLLISICPELQVVSIHAGWHDTGLSCFSFSICFVQGKHWPGGEETAKKRHLLPQMSWWSLFGLSLSLYLGLQPLWCRSLLSALGSSCLWFSLWYLATWCVFQDITSCLGTFLYSSLIPSL